MNEPLEPPLLAKFLNEATIRVLAGDRYYQRGKDYFKRGHVVSLDVFENTLQAVVRGTEDYSVEITAKGDRLDFQCDCPLGDDEEFCKHCVATALAWVHRDAPAAESKIARKAQPRTTPRKITTQDIASVLASADKGALVDLILEWSQDEPGLRAKLNQHAALALGPESAIDQARLSLEKAIRIRRFVEYREAPSYAGGVDSALDMVEKLLQAGHASPVIELCEAALRRLADACGNIDDSDGQMTELMERVGRLHLRACEAARPDPVQLAGRLFRGELLAQYNEFYGSAETYAHILGPEGLAAYRKLAEAEWAKVPVRTAEESGESRYSGARYSEGQNVDSISSIMMSLARQSGEVEQVVAILERDLSSSYNYLRIAQAYREAGNADKALAWAERGVAAFPEKTDGRLRLFLAEEYQRRDRQQEAIRMVWLDFQDHPSLNSYVRLEQFARKDDDWDEWRDRALRFIRRDLDSKAEAKTEAKTGPRTGPRTLARPGKPPIQHFAHIWRDRKRDHSLLVEIFLYEGNIDDAWREAQSGGCSEHLWLRLAEARATAKPEDAIPVFLRLAEAGIANPAGHRYDDAVTLLERAAQLHHALGRGAEFQRHLEALRAKHKPKRNFQKRMEERRRSLYLEG